MIEETGSLAAYLRSTLGEDAEESSQLFVRTEDAGLFQAFLEEVPNTLSDILGQVMRLKAGQETDIQELYRSFHILGKEWGYLGFYQLWQLCGTVEDLIEPFLDGKKLPSDSHLDILLKVLEGFRAQAERIARGLPLERIELWDVDSVLVPVRRQALELNSPAAESKALENLTLAFMPTIQRDVFFKVQEENMDDLLDHLADLSLAQNEMEKERKADPAAFKYAAAVSRMSRTTKKVRDLLLSLRQVSIKPLFDQGSWAVRQYASMFGKKIEMEIEGHQVRLDQALLLALSGPLLQLLKNAVEHGIEPEADRLAARKPAEGKLRLKANQKAGSLLIELEDDGQGLNVDKLRERGLALGILKDDKTPVSRVMEMIFKAGMTTLEGAEAGRGTGLDQVETVVEALHGSIRVQSRQGRGCKFLIKVPQSQSLIEGWVVQSGQMRFILPISQVLKVGHSAPKADEKGVTPEEEFIPVLDLGRWFGLENGEGPAFSLLVESGSRQFRVLVQEVLGEQQVLVKRNKDGKDRKPGVLGEAVLADGMIGLILDTSELAQIHEQNQSRGKV